MQTTAIGSGSQATPIANGFAALDSSEFIRVLISELRHQDPFNPQDSAALLEQLSSLRNIESQTLLGDQLKTLTNQFATLVKQNQMATAGNFVGKFVEGNDPARDAKIYGLVTAVQVKDEGVFLVLDNGFELNLNDVTRIFEAPQEITVTDDVENFEQAIADSANG